MGTFLSLIFDFHRENLRVWQEKISVLRKMTQSEENVLEEEFVNETTTDVPDAAPHFNGSVLEEKKEKPRSIKDTISEELERIGLGGKWVW